MTDGPVTGFEDDEDGDLWQFADRHRWYLPRYAADDAPDWQPAQFVSSRELFSGVREVVLDIEIGRERVCTMWVMGKQEIQTYGPDDATTTRYHCAMPIEGLGSR